MARPTRWRGRRGAQVFVGAVVLLAAVAFALPDHLSVAGFTTPGSQSTRTTSLLHRALGYDPEPGLVFLARSTRPLSARAGRHELESVIALARRQRGVVHVQGPFGRGGSRLLLSRDGRAALVLVHFHKVGEGNAGPVIDRLRAHVHSTNLRLQTGGFDVGFLDDNKVVRKDLLLAELIAFPILAGLLLLVFRGLAAAMLPLAIGGISVVGTVAGLRLISQFTGVSIYALNLATALGLGLAVDYGLFLVSRYKEELAAGAGVDDAVPATMSTAGRAVLYSGLTVAGASAAFLLFPQQFIYSMGIAGIFTALLSAGAALIVVPRLLPRVGHARGSSAHVQAAVTSGSWYRFSRWVMRHPIVVAVMSAVMILALAIPATGAHLTFLDYRALPPDLQSRKVADQIIRDFVPHLENPISVTVGHGTRADTLSDGDLSSQIAGLPGAGVVTDVAHAPDGTRYLQLLPRGPPLSAGSQDLVRELRGLGLHVGGRSADFVDLKTSIRTHAIAALAVVTVAVLVVFFILTESVVLPLKAILMNSLTVFAVFGVLVAVFQNKFLGIAGLLGFNGPSALETSITVVVVGVTLGLATDYSILLISRIKEEHDAGRDNEEAVAVGLERSGRVITNAALLCAVAIFALASSSVFIVQELALGITVGILIDATIVRAGLVPSLMRILGNINWWAPRWLHALHARLRGPRWPKRPEPVAGLAAGTTTTPGKVG